MDTECQGDLFFREPSVKAHLDDFRLPGADFGEFFEQIVDFNRLRRLVIGNRYGFVERQGACIPVALLSAALPRVIHQNAAHQARGYPKKMRAVLILNLA